MHKAGAGMDHAIDETVQHKDQIEQGVKVGLNLLGELDKLYKSSHHHQEAQAPHPQAHLLQAPHPQAHLIQAPHP